MPRPPQVERYPPQKDILKSSMPSASKGDFIWKVDLYRGNQVQVRSQGAPNPIRLMSLYRGAFRHWERHAQRKDAVKPQGEDGHRQAKDTRDPKSWGWRGRTLPWCLQRDQGPANSLVSGLWPPEQQDNASVVFQGTQLVVLTAALGNQHV